MIILVGQEAGFPVDTALHDVLRYPGEFYAWAAWHDGCLIEKYSKLPPLAVSDPNGANATLESVYLILEAFDVLAFRGILWVSSRSFFLRDLRFCNLTSC